MWTALFSAGKLYKLTLRIIPAKPFQRCFPPLLKNRLETRGARDANGGRRVVDLTGLGGRLICINNNIFTGIEADFTFALRISGSRASMRAERLASRVDTVLRSRSFSFSSRCTRAIANAISWARACAITKA